jgi:hypothetical protein
MHKQDHRVVVERVLRPGAMLRVLAGVGINGEGVAAGGQLGTPWRARRRAARRGTKPGLGRGRRVEFIPAGGGAAAVAEQRPKAKDCAGGRGGQSRARARGRRREGKGSGGLV